MGAYDNERAVRRAANLIILRKVRDKMGISREVFEKEMKIKKSSIDNIIAGDSYAGKAWFDKHAKEVAMKMKMDPDVFTGERLLYIGCDIMKVVKTQIKSKDFSDRLNESELTEDEKKKVNNIIGDEFYLWKSILEDIIHDIEDIEHQSKMSILQDISRQVEEESFNDDQLWKFWNYFRKLN